MRERSIFESHIRIINHWWHPKDNQLCARYCAGHSDLFPALQGRYPYPQLEQEAWLQGCPRAATAVQEWSQDWHQVHTAPEPNTCNHSVMLSPSLREPYAHLAMARAAMLIFIIPIDQSAKFVEHHESRSRSQEMGVDKMQPQRLMMQDYFRWWVYLILQRKIDDLQLNSKFYFYFILYRTPKKNTSSYSFFKVILGREWKVSS